MSIRLRAVATRRSNWLILLTFAGLTLLLTWPTMAHLNTHLAGGRDDLWVHQWNFWWIKQALNNGVSPFVTPYLYTPDGVALTSHNIAWFNTAIWLPLQAIFGATAAYNLIFLAVITLNGFCMFLFARAVTNSLWSGFIAGLIFGFWPYTLSHYDHTNMMVVFWLPLTLYFLDRLLIQKNGHNSAQSNGRSSWLLILFSAISLAMIGITRWQLLIMSSPILLAYPLYLLGTTPAARNKSNIWQLLLIGGLAMLLMAPLAAPLVVDQFTRDFPADAFLDEPQWGRTDLLAYFIPSIHNGLWRDQVARLYENFVVNQFYTPYLGYTTILLAGIGLLGRWRKTWFWLLLALLYFVLALGPILAVNGRSYSAIPMPYRLVEDFFLLRLLRRPDRLNLFLSLPLGMIVAWGITFLQAKVLRPWPRRITFTTIILLILLAYWPAPFASTAPTIPAWYQSLAADNEPFGVFDIPVNDRSYDKWYMLYQTVHGKPMATGHVSRLPREATAFLHSVPAFANLRERDQRPDLAIGDVSGQLQMLAEANIRYLVIHKRFANEGLQAIWRDWLSIKPFYEDDELIVYRTAPRFAEDFDFAHAFGDGLGLITATITPEEVVQGGILNSDLRWATAVTPQANYNTCLQLRDQNDNVQFAHCAPLPDQLAAANAIQRIQTALTIPDDIAPGVYEITLSLSDPLSGETLLGSIMLRTVKIQPFAPTYTTDVAWNGRIHLRGYDWQFHENEIQMTSYWQAENELTPSYKIFIHVIDETTGEIIAQSDHIPRNWTYPTTAWQPQEIVRDEISLPLTGPLPPEIRLHIGLYEEQSGRRLLLNDGQEYFQIEDMR